jgi:outer membrane protein
MSRALFLATAAMLSSTPAHATDLVDAWRAAALHDPDHQSAEAERDAGQEAAVQARALKRPSVQVQAGYQYNMTETNAQLPEDLTPVFTGQRSSGRASVAVQAVQPIYDAAKGAQSTQLREKAAIADVQFEGEQQALILRVADAYFSVLSGEDKLTSYTRQVEAAEQQRKGAQARFDAGRARITDVREAEAQRDAAEAQRIGAEAELAYARAAFSELTGLGAEGLERPAADFVAPVPTGSLQDIQERAETRAPAVRAAEHSARAAGAEIDRYGLSGRPVIEGVAGYQGQFRMGGDGGNGIVPDRIQTASAGVRLTVPLYAGGGIQSKEREAQANATKALRDLDAARRDARLQAQQAWQAASTGARRVAALNTALRSADLQQSAAATGRDVGIRTQNDVLNAQSQSFATDRDRAQAVYDYILARLKLAASTGDLGFEELDEADRLITSIRPETRP